MAGSATVAGNKSLKLLSTLLYLTLHLQSDNSGASWIAQQCVTVHLGPYLHVRKTVHFSLMELLHGFVGTFFGHELHKAVSASHARRAESKTQG